MSAPDLDGNHGDDYSPLDWRTRAACIGLHRLFDPSYDGEGRASVTARHEQAIQVCGHCPVIDECRSWIRSSPRRYRLGVVAGHEYLQVTAKESSDD